MKKIDFLSFLLYTIVLWGILYIFYPCTFRWMEGDSLFLTTSEYLQSIVVRPLGITRLISNFLYQFYYYPLAGTFIFALLVALLTFVVYRLIRRFTDAFSWMAFFLFPLSVLLWVPELLSVISLLAYSLALLFYMRLSSQWARCLFLLFFSVVGIEFIPTVGLLLLYLFIGGVELRRKAKLSVAFALGVGFLMVCVMPFVWSLWIDFVPVESRFPKVLTNLDWKDLVGYVVPMFGALMGKVRIKWFKPWGGMAMVLCFYGLSLVVLVKDENMQMDENCYQLSYWADEKNWAEILQNTTYEDRCSNPIKLRYALLAEENQGTLGNNLFVNPINTPETFLFRHTTTPFYLNFNRQFYDCLNVPDEGFHMAFEYGVLTENGLCMKSLRDMYMYSVEAGDSVVAEKYKYLLEHTTLMKNWPSTLDSKSFVPKARNHNLEPDRSDTFIGGYPFNSEMVRLFEHDTKNKTALDYLLYGLLLQKELDKFCITLRYYPVYKNKQLPQNLAEAVAMYAYQHPDIWDVCKYDSELEKRFKDFYTKIQSQQDVSEYKDTYWYYHFFAEIPTEAEVSNSNN